MNKYIRLIAIGLLAVSLDGCSLDSSKLAQYNDMKNIKEYLDSSIEIDKYNNTILFITSEEAQYSKYVMDNADKYKDTLDSSAIAELENKATSISEDSLNNDGEGESDGDVYDIKNLTEKNGTYPIYGKYFRVTRYGTKEEAVEAINNFNKLPLTEIQDVQIYRDMVVARLDNKYGGQSMIRMMLKDGKIHEFKAYQNANKN